MKQRIKLADRQLPNYSKGEANFNMVSHIVGAGSRYCSSCALHYWFRPGITVESALFPVAFMG